MEIRSPARLRNRRGVDGSEIAHLTFVNVPKRGLSSCAGARDVRRFGEEAASTLW
jgi:hypothetical protein